MMRHQGVSAATVAIYPFVTSKMNLRSGWQMQLPSKCRFICMARPVTHPLRLCQAEIGSWICTGDMFASREGSKSCINTSTHAYTASMTAPCRRHCARHVCEGHKTDLRSDRGNHRTIFPRSHLLLHHMTRHGKLQQVLEGAIDRESAQGEATPTNFAHPRVNSHLS